LIPEIPMTITHIKASLGEKLIANADRYYTAAIPQIVDELVQNARRAGAGTITVDLTAQRLVFSDDGRGLVRDQAPVLIRLGGSNNETITETAENAAGIGFFSLAHCDVRVFSQDWMMEIPREAFVGKADALLQDAPSPRRGMKIEITGLETRVGYDRLASGQILIEACRYSGLTLVLTGFGTADGAYAPRSFLDDGVVDNAVILRRECHGLSIQLVRAPLDEKLPCQINFFGKVIALDLGSRLPLYSEEIGRIVEKQDHRSAYVSSTTHRTKIRIEVRDTSVLRLQLPERNAVIVDQGYERVIATLDALYLELLSGLTTANGIPLTAAIRAATGTRLAPPTLIIRDGLEIKQDYGSKIGISTAKGILLTSGKTVALTDVVAIPSSSMLTAHLTASMAEKVVENLTFASLHDMIQAYGEDVPCRTSDFTYTVKLSDEEYQIPVEAVSDEDIAQAIEDEEIDLSEQLIDDASLSFAANGRRITIPVCAVVGAQHGDESEAFVAAVAGAAVHEIVHLMLESLSWDDESEDWKESRRAAARGYEARLATLFGHHREMFVERLKERLFDLSLDHLRGMSAGEVLQTSFTITRGEHGFDIALAS
jgi:hypothetical protein